MRANETEQERVRRELRQLHEVVDRVHTQANQRIDTLTDGLAQTDARLKANASDRWKRASRQERRTVLHRDFRAGQLFMLGAVLSLTGALIG